MKLSIVIVAFFISLALLGQAPYFIQYDLENGCPTNNLYDVIQDSNGYIWIAGEEGIAKFDGKSFKSIGDKQIDVTNLTIGKNDIIWAVGFNNTLLKIENDSISIELNWNNRSTSKVLSFVYDKENDFIWLSAYKNYFYRYQPSTSKLDSFKILSNNKVKNQIAPHSITPQGVFDNKVFFGVHNNGLYQMNYKTRKITPLNIVDKPKDSNLSTGIFFKFNSKTYWINTWKHRRNIVYELEGTTLRKNVQLSNQLKTNQVVRVKVVDEILICSSNNGVFIFNKKLQLQNNHALVSDFFCTQTIIDTEGSMWMSTLKDGLIYLPNPLIKHYTIQNSTIPETSIYSLETHNNLLYFSSNFGNFYSWNRNADFKTILILPEQIEIQSNIKLNPDNLVYFGSPQHLYIFDPSTLKFILKCNFNIGNDLEFYKNKIVSTTSTNAWIVSNPLRINSPFPSFAYNIKDPYNYTTLGKVKRMGLSKERSVGCTNNTIDSSLWVATRTRLLRFSESDGIDTIRNNDQEITAYALDSDLKIGVWVSTHQGVMLFIKDSVRQHFQYPQQLLDDEITLLKVIGNNLYLGSKNGLQQYNTVTKEFQNYQKLDGLPTHSILDVEEMGDYIYASSSKGLIEIPKHLKTHNATPPKLIFEKLVLNQTDTLHPTNKLELTYQENNLQVHLNALSYRSQGNYQIHYQLEGIDEEWIKSEENYPIARYSNLKHGKYTFKAKALNEDGVESQEMQLSIRITPAFWQTIWFYSLCALLVLFLGYFSVRLRFRQLKQRSDLEKKVINSEITALKSQMNPHFIFNALNSIQGLIMKQDVRSTNIYLGKFASLLRLVLANSSKEKITLEKELKMLRTYLDLEKLRFGDDFNVSIIIDPQLEPDIVLIHPMILQPYIENAIKHGLLHQKGSKRLDIEFRKEGQYVICYISDNGIGRDASKAISKRREKYHTSFSQEANEKRIDLINAVEKEKVSLEISDLSPGTQVKIGFPQQDK